jgi:hypothetical protein
MLNSKLLVLFLLSLFLLSCNENNKKKEYYDTGELYMIEKLIDKKNNIWYAKVYSKKGYLESEGYTDSKGTPNGNWKEYFSDGKLKWQGHMEGKFAVVPEKVLYEMYKQFAMIQIDDDSKQLQVGQKYKLRTYIEGVSPNLYAVVDSTLNLLDSNRIDPENFPFEFVPEKAGVYYVLLMLPDSNGNVIAGKSICQRFALSVTENPDTIRKNQMRDNGIWWR